jgi:hypothetical protein
MKRKLPGLIIALFSLTTFNATAQQNFIRYYNAAFSSALQATNGNLLFTAGIQFINSTNQSVFCTDSSGNVIWANKITTNGSNCEMVETQSHEFIVATGWDNPSTGKLCPGIFKVDSGGNLLWAKIFVCDTSDVYALKILRTTDNHNVLLATEIVQHTLKAIIKFDDNGNIIWAKNGSALPVATNFAIPVEAGSLLLMNVRNMAPGDILKLSAGGNVVWSNTYSFASASTMMTGDAQLLPNGNYLVCTNPFPNSDTTELILLEIDPQGAVINSNALKFEGYWFPNQLNVSASPAGDLLLHFTNYNRNIGILKTDGVGNPVWMDKVNSVSGGGSSEVEHLGNGRFLMITDVGFGSFFMIQSDVRLSSGFSCFEPFDSVTVHPEAVTQVTNSYSVGGLGCTQIAITPVYTAIQLNAVEYCIQVAVNEEEKKSLLVIFPNPAGEFAQLVFDKIISGKVSINAIDGREIKKYSVLNENKILLYTGDLPKGIYTVSVQEPGRSYVQKLIK